MFRESEKKSPPSNLLNGSLFFKRDLLNEFDRFPNVTIIVFISLMKELVLSEGSLRLPNDVSKEKGSSSENIGVKKSATKDAQM